MELELPVIIRGRAYGGWLRAKQLAEPCSMLQTTVCRVKKPCDSTPKAAPGSAMKMIAREPYRRPALQISRFLSDDYFRVAPEEIRRIESVLTVVGGKIVYGAGDYASLAPSLPAS